MASKEATSSYPTIQPHGVSKGTDICAVGSIVYIIRSDLKCYMVTSDLHNGLNIAVHALHPACQEGDHYFANSDGFYIIKGDSVRFVKNLTTDDDAKVFSLHPNCRGGTHYVSDDSFSISELPAVETIELKKYRLFPSLRRIPDPVPNWKIPVNIIWADQGKARNVCNLNTDEDGSNFLLASDYKDGLYYWSSLVLEEASCAFLKPAGQWGVTYHTIENLQNNQRGFHNDGYDQSVSPDIVPFLPGGLTITQGPAYGRWELIHSFKNESDTTVHWERTIKHQVGYKKSELESIERHWDVKVSASCGLTASIAKLHFSAEASYGRIKRQTSQEEWTDSTEESKAISYDIEPGKTVYIWQYQLGFGNKPVLFARDIAATSSSEPPTENP